MSSRTRNNAKLTLGNVEMQFTIQQVSRIRAPQTSITPMAAGYFAVNPFSSAKKGACKSHYPRQAKETSIKFNLQLFLA